MATYYTLLTKIGQAKIANAVALGDLVAWTHMAVGDGNGNPTTPNENQTTLVRETYRALINQLTVDPDNPNYMVAEMIIPTTVGGWAVNEVGIFDEDGDLIAVANFPATYKPQLEEGSGRDLVIRIVIQVSNTSVVTLKVDPAIILASQKWVQDQFVKKVTVAGGTTGQLLAKASNADEDFVFVDPEAAVDVTFTTRTERQTLAADQVIINLATLTTVGIGVYVEGVRLIETIDYTVNSATQFTLARSYPAGSRIHTYQNDQLGDISQASETQNGLIRLATTLMAQGLADDTSALTPKKLADAFKGANQSLAINGRQDIPGGLIVQWGRFISSASAGAAVAVTFPDEFPTNVHGLILTGTSSGAATTSAWFDTPTPTGFNGHSNLTSVNVFWIAIGY